MKNNAPLTTSQATASFGDDIFGTICSRTASEFLDSLAPAAISFSVVTAYRKVVLRVHVVTLSGVIYMTVEESSVTAAGERHAIHTTHLVKN